MSIPWLYTRRQLADRWRVPPWVIDDVPWYEIDTELQIAAIEAEARAFRDKTYGKGS